MRTILLVPFRENLSPPLHRNVEHIAYQWIARWSWWNALVALAQPLKGNG